MKTHFLVLLALGALAVGLPLHAAGPLPGSSPERTALPASLTPPAPATPRINGPSVFGVRPGSPFVYV